MAPSTELLDEIPFVAFDLETTGLSPHRDRIVEFGAVHFRLNGGVVGEFAQLVNPGKSIPRRAVLIHGITDADVRGVPTVAATLPQFIEFLDTSSAILLAHNAKFDVGFVQAGLRSHRIRGFKNPVVDTLQLAKHVIPGLRRYSLQHLVATLDVNANHPHRALSDAQTVMRVFCKLLQLKPQIRTREQLFGLAQPVANHTPPQCQQSSRVHHPQLAKAIREQRLITLYPEGGGSPRRVIPRRLVKSKGVVCLLVYCQHLKAEKAFPLDHIRRLHVPN